MIQLKYTLYMPVKKAKNAPNFTCLGCFSKGHKREGFSISFGIDKRSDIHTWVPQPLTNRLSITYIYIESQKFFKNTVCLGNNE